MKDSLLRDTTTTPSTPAWKASCFNLPNGVEIGGVLCTDQEDSVLVPY